MNEIEDLYGWVLHQAKAYYKDLQRQVDASEIQLDELEAEGVLALVAAAKRFDPGRGIKFKTFVAARVNGAFKDYLRKRDPLPQKPRKQLRDLNEAGQELARDLGREPTNAELAKALNVSDDEVRKRRSRAVIILSIDETDSKNERSIRDIPSPAPGPEAILERKQLGGDMDGCVETTLDDTERKILSLWVMGGVTLQAVSKLLDMPTATVHRRANTAKKKIRQCMANKGWDVGID